MKDSVRFFQSRAGVCLFFGQPPLCDHTLSPAAVLCWQQMPCLPAGRRNPMHSVRLIQTAKWGYVIIAAILCALGLTLPSVGVTVGTALDVRRFGMPGG